MNTLTYRAIYLLALLFALATSAGATGGKWNPKNSSGEDLGIYVDTDDTLQVTGAALLKGVVTRVKIAISDSDEAASKKYVDSLIVAGTRTIQLQDTTLATSGKRVIAGSLLLDQWNCVKPTFAGATYNCGGSFNKFRETEKLLSIHNASRSDTLNVWPALWQAQITTAGDSLVLLDQATGRIWWVLKSAAANACSSGTFNDISISDGIIHLGTSKGKCEIDFQQDIALIYTTAGVWKYRGNLHQRNDALHLTLLAASPAIVSNTVNAVSTTRDAFGRTDGVGRLAQWWGIGTSTRSTYYNPVTNTLNDLTGGNNSRNSMKITSRGSIYETVDMASGTQDTLVETNSIFKYTADANASNALVSGTTAPNVINWANTSALPVVAVVERGSWANAGDIAIYGSDLGAYFLHMAPGNAFGKTDSVAAKIRVTNTYIGSPEFGDCVLNILNTDNTSDATKYANTLTATNSPAFNSPSISIPWSGAYSNKASTSYLVRVTDTDFRTTAGQSFIVQGCFKPASATNPSAAQLLFSSRSKITTIFSQITIGLDTDGSIYGQHIDNSNNQDAPQTAGLDVYDGNWHHVALVGDGIASLKVYVDGQLNASDVSIAATSATTMDTVALGASVIGANVFVGKLSHWSFSKGVAPTPAAIKTIANAMLASFNVEPAGRHLSALDVDYVQSYGSSVVMGNQDSCIVWDGVLGLPLPKRRYGSPGGSIQDAALIPGAADSLGVSMGTTTKTQIIQPDPRIVDVAAFRGPFVQPAIGERAVVDSAGVNGLFWKVQDAELAAMSANVKSVFIERGTYPLWAQPATISGISYEGASDSTVIFADNNTYFGIQVLGNHCTFRGISARSTPGGGGDIAWQLDGYDNTMINCMVPTSDSYGIYISGPRNIVIGCRVYATDTIGIELAAAADNCIVTNNLAQGIGTTSINISAGASDNVVLGNRLDGAISDGGTSTVGVASNSTTTF